MHSSLQGRNWFLDPMDGEGLWWVMSPSYRSAPGQVIPYIWWGVTGKMWPIAQIEINCLMSASALCVLPGARPIVSTKSRVSLVIKVRLGVQAELRAGWGHTHSRLSSEHTQTKHQPSDLFTKQIPPRSGIPLLSSLSWNIAGECCQWSPGARSGHRQQKLDKWSSMSASAPSLVIKMSCRPSLPAKIWTHTIRHPAIICTKQTTKLKVQQWTYRDIVTMIYVFLFLICRTKKYWKYFLY